MKLFGLYRMHPIALMKHKDKKAKTQFFGKFSWNFRKILGKLRQYFCVISHLLCAFKRLFKNLDSAL